MRKCLLFDQLAAFAWVGHCPALCIIRSESASQTQLPPVVGAKWTSSQPLVGPQSNSFPRPRRITFVLLKLRHGAAVQGVGRL